MHFKKWSLFFCLFLFILTTSGCVNIKERRTITKSKKVLAKRDKDIEELVEVRGELKRILEMKIKTVRLLESTDRLLGKKYMEIGSYRLAEDSLLEAEGLMPYNAFIKNDLGECYYFLAISAIEDEERLEFLSKSKRYYQKALDIKPDLLDARYGLGILLFFGFDDGIGAIDEMKAILEYDPDYIDAHFALGRFYYEMGELGKSLNEYITLTRILPRTSPRKTKAEENIIRINRELGINE